MISNILIALTILFIIANLYIFFTNKSYKKSTFNAPLFYQLFFNMIGIALGFAVLYFLLSLNGTILKVGSPTGDPADQSFGNLLYFSGVTLLSIGYGDYVPVGSVKLFAVLEASIGILLPAAYFMKAFNNGKSDNRKD
ncbi:potassium channel family protein [Aquibacillus rhizosphaerae]|uniref:Potassium channel family protein n=1 Tax=Aquibacillus rhizosphaerae TaxID=3051431 RepID=A0ABT7LAW2_9BACI|nr:potassium channel family protein [Aquibacillus sp. LR5S19]MDL4843009.1 potassium channel family protein [Aquibacillus sp. LR5S19]